MKCLVPRDVGLVPTFIKLEMLILDLVFHSRGTRSDWTAWTGSMIFYFLFISHTSFFPFPSHVSRSELLHCLSLSFVFGNLLIKLSSMNNL
ncbi:hypothetical protein EUGRSUZ_C04233 [Eucalyptus grandis]|uniref:Uncharacterized protein n=2 Tax=Eucalyptus grandis TaxID=71139 RepID=A0A059CXB8_EUCGR|nr:hypothetical protein EUGRSUZ_C04233 [Eucalyptus grandis]